MMLPPPVAALAKETALTATSDLAAWIVRLGELIEQGKYAEAAARYREVVGWAAILAAHLTAMNDHAAKTN